MYAENYGVFDKSLLIDPSCFSVGTSIARPLAEALRSYLAFLLLSSIVIHIMRAIPIFNLIYMLAFPDILIFIIHNTS